MRDVSLMKNGAVDFLARFTDSENFEKTFKEGMAAVKQRAQEELDDGFDRRAFEDSIASLLANGTFTEDASDVHEFDDLLVGRSHKAPAKRLVSGEVRSAVADELSNLANTYEKKFDAGNARATIQTH